MTRSYNKQQQQSTATTPSALESAINATPNGLHSEIKINGFTKFVRNTVLSIGDHVMTWKGNQGPIPGFETEKILYGRKIYEQDKWFAKHGKRGTHWFHGVQSMIRLPVAKNTITTTTPVSKNKPSKTVVKERYSLDLTAPAGHVWLEWNDMCDSNNFHEPMPGGWRWSWPRKPLPVEKFFKDEVKQHKGHYKNAKLNDIIQNSGMTLEEFYKKQQEERKLLWEIKNTENTVNASLKIAKVLATVEQTAKLISEKRLTRSHVDSFVEILDDAYSLCWAELPKVTLEAQQRAAKKWEGL